MVEPLPSIQGTLGLISGPEKGVTGQSEGKKNPHISKNKKLPQKQVPGHTMGEQQSIIQLKMNNEDLCVLE